MFRDRRKVDPPAFALGHDGHQPRAHAAGRAFGLDVIAGSIGIPDIRQLEVGAARQLRARAWPGSGVLRLAHLDGETVAAVLDHRLDPGLLARLAGEHEGARPAAPPRRLKAGLGLLTVRAHSQAMTVSLRPTSGRRSGRSCAIAALISILG
jgi:hypothetical protein